MLPVIPAKGSLWVRHNSSHREGGVDSPCVYQVTSVRSGQVYVQPTWETPVFCRPVPVPLEREMGWTGNYSRSFHELFSEVIS